MILPFIAVVAPLPVLWGLHVLWSKSKTLVLEIAGLVAFLCVYLSLTGIGIELGADWLREDQVARFFLVSVVAFSGAGIVNAIENAKA
jgi:hypothetical protein